MHGFFGFRHSGDATHASGRQGVRDAEPNGRFGVLTTLYPPVAPRRARREARVRPESLHLPPRGVRRRRVRAVRPRTELVRNSRVEGARARVRDSRLRPALYVRGRCDAVPAHARSWHVRAVARRGAQSAAVCVRQRSGVFDGVSGSTERQRRQRRQQRRKRRVGAV